MFNEKLDSVGHHRKACADLYHTGLGRRSPARTKITTAHAVPRDWRVLVVLPGSQLLHPPPRLHSRKCQGILRNINSRQYLPLLCARCWYSVTFTGHPSAQRPTAIASNSAYFLWKLQPTTWRAEDVLKCAMRQEYRHRDCSAKQPRLNQISMRGPEKLRGEVGMMQLLKMFGRLMSSTLHIHIHTRPENVSNTGTSVQVWMRRRGSRETRSAGRLTANLLHDFTNHTVHQINTAAPRAMKTPKKASLNIWH